MSTTEKIIIIGSSFAILFLVIVAIYALRQLMLLKDKYMENEKSLKTVVEKEPLTFFLVNITKYLKPKLWIRLIRSLLERLPDEFKGEFKRYPTAYHTVDIIATDGLGNVLFGRKKDKTEVVVIGGFVDPTDNSAEDAAIREFREEATFKLEKKALNYIGSFKINDERYFDSPDKIITSCFHVDLPLVFADLVNTGELKAGDDIEELVFIGIHDLQKDYKTKVDPKHHVLIEAFLRLVLNK